MFRTCFAATIVEVKGARQAVVTSRFDVEPQGLPNDANLLSFCFPLGPSGVTPREYQATEEFLFALTGGKGDRLYGFCRLSLPPVPKGTTLARYPQALCIVSSHPWSTFMFRVLEVVDRTLRTLPSLEGHPLLAELDGVTAPALGSVVRLRLPAGLLGPGGPLPRQHRCLASLAEPGAWLEAGESGWLELEVPPDVGGGAVTAGVALAPLLWYLTPRLAVSLLGALLLERRIVLVSADLGRLSAAVTAAAALLFPFCWQHIFLPIVPASLIDYLAAPMPFLAGVPAACLPALRRLAMEEALVIDLDTLGAASPAPGGPRDDALLLPHADALEAAFDELRDALRSPVEATSTPRAAEIVRAWAVRVFGTYRSYVRKEGIGAVAAPTPVKPGRASWLQASAAGGGGAKSGKDTSHVDAGAGDDGDSRSRRSPSPRRRPDEEDGLVRAHGYVFDLGSFVAAPRRGSRAAVFLAAFRHSQMLEVFASERCAAAAAGYPLTDAFEAEVSDTSAAQSTPLSAAAARAASGPAVKFGTLWKRTSLVMRASSETLVSAVRQLSTLQDDDPLPG